jgi:ABC-2 type transport system permease protein
MFRLNVIAAVFGRNVLSFFSSMLGYLFIIAFVLAGAFAAFDDEFFAHNETSLDQLTQWFPQLLIFIIPAITMSMWSDEKKLGTDELLFTLPGADWEILLGKYLAGLFTYTVILAFSLSHALVLEWIGSPDWGVIASTFVGYWVAGAAMVAIGMFASVLTSSSTVAFVLGAIFCAIPVYIDIAPWVDVIKETVNFREPLSIGGNLAFFALGMIPVNGVIYFVLLTVFFLYLNAVAVARRHWGGSPWGISYGWQYAVRVIALAVVVGSLSFIGSKAAGMRLDLTSERLFTLTQTTLDTIDRIDPENSIKIDAYITPQVPEQYLQVQKNLYGVLRQLERKAGNKLQVRIVNTEPATPEAEEALTWGIKPEMREVEERGRRITSQIFMGLVVRSGFDQVVIPFFDKGTPVEYELTRSIGTALKDTRLTLGILETRAELIGPEEQNEEGKRERREWRIVKELRKQYNVKSVPAGEPIEEAFDVLLAVMPSTLENEQIKHLTDYVKSGRPVLLIEDSYPSTLRYLTLYPGFNDLQGGGQFGMGGGGPPVKPNLDELLRTLGITWKKGDVVFDTFNPHPAFEGSFPPEYMFLTSELQNFEESCLNLESPITAPFREVLLLFAGHVDRDPTSNLTFEPLLRTRKKTTGVENVNDMFGWTGGFPGMGQVFPRHQQLDHNPDKLKDYVVGARIKSNDENGVNAIVLTDIEFISDMLYDVWEQQYIDLSIDNVLIVLNSIDALAGNDGYLALRGRYRRPRNLERVEREREVHQRNLTTAKTKAMDDAKKQIQDAQKHLQEEVERIEKSDTIDEGEKLVQVRTLQEVLGRKVQQDVERIQRETDSLVRKREIEVNQAIKDVENLVRIQALVIPPLLPLAVGLMVLGLRILGEQRGIAKERMVKGIRK